MHWKSHPGIHIPFHQEWKLQNNTLFVQKKGANALERLLQISKS